MRRILRFVSLASLSLVATFPAVSQQALTAPADPVAAIEGSWKGQWDDYEIEVNRGVVTLTKGDPETYAYLKPGTVLARLGNDGGKREGRVFRFSASRCLSHNGFNLSNWEMIQCGDYSAVLTRSVNSMELNVAGLAFRRSD